MKSEVTGILYLVTAKKGVVTIKKIMSGEKVAMSKKK
jgi:hypothetical protein